MVKRPHDTVQQDAAPPGDTSTTTPISGEAAAARLRIKAVEDSVAEIKDDIREIKNHRHIDFVHLIQIFGSGFVILAGMLIAAYFIVDAKFEKLGNRVDALSVTVNRADAKLEELLGRISPIQRQIPAPQNK